MRKIYILKNSINGNYTGWCMQSNNVWKTTNSGANWNVISHIGLPNPYCAQFFDQNTGITVGTYGSIFRTTNGGVTFDSVPGNPAVSANARRAVPQGQGTPASDLKLQSGRPNCICVPARRAPPSSD